MDNKDIFRTQRMLPWFNQIPFNLPMTQATASMYAIDLIPDSKEEHGRIELYKDAYCVFYQPDLPDLLKTLIITHELGHFINGHIDQKMKLAYSDIFLTPEQLDNHEIEASVFSLMAVIPSNMLIWENCKPVGFNDMPIGFNELEEIRQHSVLRSRLAMARAAIAACSESCPRGQHSDNCHIWRQFWNPPKKNYAP